MAIGCEGSGVVFEFEPAAIAGHEMPTGLTGPEQRLFLSLRMLYHQRRAGIIDRDTAVREKKKLVRAFDYEKFQDKCGKHSVALWKAAEGGANAYGRDRTLENADRVMEAIYGVKRKEVVP